MTASWQDRLRHALQAHALVEAGDRARGITTSTAALHTMQAVQAAIERAIADGVPEADVDAALAAHCRPACPPPSTRSTTTRSPTE
jgi:predicted glycoside hydrolase/deacetylase ChbG (UPF0249 family)